MSINRQTRCRSADGCETSAILRFIRIRRQAGRLRRRSGHGLLLGMAGLAVLLGACGTTDFSRFGGGEAEARAFGMANAGRHAEAAAVYIDLASRADGPERERLTMLAAEQWLDTGDGRRAITAMRQVPRPASGEMLWLWSSNSAAIALWEGRPDDAQRTLEPLGRQALPLEYRSRVEALRADAWFQKDQPVRAINLYLQREHWLDDRARKDLNRQRLWAGLLASDPRTLRTAVDTVSDPLLRGWLALGALATATGRQGIGWSSGVRRWQEAHRNHPANAVLANLRLPDGSELEYPRHIALLLPLSGRNAAAGQAVQNGFFGAYFSATAGLGAVDAGSAPAAAPPPGGADAQPEPPVLRPTVFDDGIETRQKPAGNGQPSIRVYDADAENSTEAYARAVADGAEFVVGPLLRPGVTALARETTLPVPVLALNYLPDDIAAPPGFYQFALAPEDEAASAATRAVRDGYSRAIALVPNNDWGRRVLSSFATEFESSGGTLLDYRNYQPTTQDFSVEIESLMALTGSVQRYQRLRANIGGPLQFDPRRRQDAEFVFLAADSKAGRLIKSQLKFHYAGDLPVYSTSFIYTMDGRSDADLNGVMFADTPWIVSPQDGMANLPALYNRYWPAEKRLGRLQAMGYDAYQLVAELFSERTRPMPELAGATGRLYLDEDGRIHRRLAWATFVRGQVTPLQHPDPVEEPQRELDDEVDGRWRRQLPNP